MPDFPEPSEALEAPQSQPLVGIGWMFLAGITFVAFTAAAKSLGDDVPAAQGAFLRFALALPFVLPVLVSMRADLPRGRDLRLFVFRALVHVIAVVCWFFAMARIPIAEVTAINYLTPVYVTLGAVLFLGERLAIRRIAAICVALLGALIILRPGFRELDPGHLAMLVTSLMLGASYLIAKSLSARYPPGVIVAFLTASVTIGLVPIAFVEWVPLTFRQFLYCALAALFATAGHYCMTQAFRAAPVATTQPVTFLQLVWASLLGAAVFGEPLDPYVILGGSVIVAAVSFIAWREMVLSAAKPDTDQS